MTGLRLAIFDCDGTLIDSAANIVTAMTSAFESCALPAPTPEQVRHIIGLSLDHAVAALAPEAAPKVHDDLVAHYKRAFAGLRQGAMHEDGPLYPGVRAGLHHLHDTGWLLAVATGKSRRGLHYVLDHHGLRDLFVSLQTADDAPSKPHPAMIHAALDETGIAPDRAVMIGDTTFDMQMARQARIVGLGVTWGYHSADMLRDAGAAAVLSDFPRLIAAAETHIPV